MSSLRFGQRQIFVPLIFPGRKALGKTR